jgi:hypothetical protein
MAPKFSKHSFSEETLSVRLRNWHTKFSLSSGRTLSQACKFLFGNSFWLVFSCPRSTASSRVVGYRRSPVHYLFGPMYCSLHPGAFRNGTTLGLKFIQSLILKICKGRVLGYPFKLSGGLLFFFPTWTGKRNDISCTPPLWLVTLDLNDHTSSARRGQFLSESINPTKPG